MRMRALKSFTLIELLIVVAIIAILAAIAVPNFLEAQVRAKVSHVKTDLRTVATALEMYMVDNNRAPVGMGEGVYLGLWWWLDDAGDAYNALTSPIAYLTAAPKDVFRAVDQYYGWYNYEVFGDESNPAMYEHKWNAYRLGYKWVLNSQGPTRRKPAGQLNAPWIVGEQLADGVYDASNGTVTGGQIIRTNKGEYSGPVS